MPRQQRLSLRARRAEELLDGVKGERVRLAPAGLPSTDGGQGEPETAGQLFLGEPQDLPNILRDCLDGSDGRPSLADTLYHSR